MAEKDVMEDIADELVQVSPDAEATISSQNALDRAIHELEGIAPSTEAPQSTSSSGKQIDAANFVWGIPLEVSVIIGKTELSVARLMELGSGDVLALDRQIHEPLDIVINGRNIAKGEITLIDDGENRFGIRVTELAGPQNRDSV